jgi:predicted PhzF superfamily epimerase YddE/YHI9
MTAFFVPEGDHYGLRWVNSTVELELCGHGTFASAYIRHHLCRLRER